MGKISIHALREEGDGKQDLLKYSYGISIHALREEGDGAALMRFPLRAYFYPRPPRGGRLSSPVLQELGLIISIHALREEGDGGAQTQCLRVAAAFLSTPSARRATL